MYVSVFLRRGCKQVTVSKDFLYGCDVAMLQRSTIDKKPPGHVEVDRMMTALQFTDRKKKPPAESRRLIQRLHPSSRVRR